MHQNRARIRGLAARDVKAHRINGRDALAEAAAHGVSHREAFSEFLFVKHADAFRGFFKGLTLLGGKRLKGVLHLVGRHHQVREFFCGQMVKLCRVLKHGGVAAFAHVFDNGFRALGDHRIDTRVMRHEMIELFLKVCVLSG